MGNLRSGQAPAAIDTRYYALDALRASMLLLGLVQFTHSFRMPIFFVLAGFFAAMLHEKRGAAGFASNRALRILIPFVIGVLLLQLCSMAGATKEA